MGRPTTASKVVLKEIRVRPVRTAEERAEWDDLMSRHHYLGFRCLFGGGVRHVAETREGRWVGLLGWVSGSFKVKARDEWIGWAPEQQFRRLYLVANNTRFLLLPGYNGGNLASRVLSLSLRRLSGDFEAFRGVPVLLAETFVDPTRFHGGCYRAANWTLLGETRGYARVGGKWEQHGVPKQVFVRPLCGAAQAMLRGLDEPVPGLGSVGAPPPPGRLRSLYQSLSEVPEYRAARGIRHPLASILAVAVAAKLAGAQGVTAIAEFARRLDQRQLAAIRAFKSPSLGCRVPVSKTSLHRVLSQLDPDALDKAVRRWTAAYRLPQTALALDGKSRPINRPGHSDSTRMMIAAVEHGTGMVHGQVASDSAGGEILGVRRLLTELGVRGHTITLDALHSCPETAHLIVTGGGDYVMPVKSNRPTLLDDIRTFNFDAEPKRRTLEKAHGRIEQRECALIDLTQYSPDLAALPGRQQAFRITRQRTVIRSGTTTPHTTSTEYAYGLTSLSPERAGPSEILALNRGHWEIENCLHHVRDVSFDEDRSRVRVGAEPRNLACLSNVAISIVRLHARFRHQPEAQRHYAARHDEALQAVLDSTL